MEETYTKVIVASNRLPITIKSPNDSEFQIEKSVGGLATGLQTVLEGNNSIWVGWPGKISQLREDIQKEAVTEIEKLSLKPVLLSDSEIKNFYEDYCNGILWPLFHSLTGEIPIEIRGFDDYVKVNQKFADTISSIYKEGDLIWIHDIHLMLVPSLIRVIHPNAKIGFFLHIPFPPPEIFVILPQREYILQGILSSDLIGFHTISYMRHFTMCVIKVMGLKASVDSLFYQERVVKLGVFPMGIDTQKFESLADEKETQLLMEKYKGNGDIKILLGIDRLDYTKGLPRRLQAFEILLEKYPEYIGKIRLVQVAVPSRTDVDAYKEYRRKVEVLVAKIQGRFSTPDWTPIHYMFKSFESRQIVALYRSADIMLVTPVRDGMNLVAKEYVASRIDSHGVLVLSEFAGASHELTDALFINPYSPADTATVLHEALSMPVSEQEKRMKGLREQVQENTINEWISSFLNALQLEATPQSHVESSKFVVDILRKKIKKHNRSISDGHRSLGMKHSLRSSPKIVLFLDYDGTLVDFTNDPMSAKPSERVISLLQKLGEIKRLSVHIISGREKKTLSEWFGNLPVQIHAEHGAYSKIGNRWLCNFHESSDTSWKESIRKLLKEFSKSIPGTFIEEKEFSIAWHYRLAENDISNQVNNLKLHLLLVANGPFSVIYGNKVIEICPSGLNKGLAVKKTIERLESMFASSADQIIHLAVGDDNADEFMFSAIPENGVSVHVGASNFSVANYCVEDISSVLDMLEQIPSLLA